MNISLDKYFEDIVDEEELEEEHPLTWTEFVDQLSYAKLKWQETASCFNIGRGVMFPVRHSGQIKVAEAVCTTCPHIVDCLFFAIVSREINGVWGGTTEHAREQLLNEISLTEYSDYRFEWSDEHHSFLWNVANLYVENSKAINQEHIQQTQA